MYRILYVDDESDLLEISKLFLEQSGEFSVDTLVSAQEALEARKIPSYDAIVSDYQMPGMNGIAFLKKVREQFGNIPFILFTGRGREEVVIEAINAGVDFYLQKGGAAGAQYAELAQKIRHVVIRKRAEGALADSEARLRSFIEATGDAVCLIDEEGRIIEWNSGSERLSGIKKEDALGRYVWDITTSLIPREQRREEQQGETEQRMRAMLRTGNPIFESPRIVEAERPDGTRIITRQTIIPIRTDKGFRFGSITQDITEERRADAILRESEGKFRKIFETSMVGMALITLDFRFLSVNPAWIAITGYEEAELLNMTIQDLTHPDQRDTDIKRLQELRAGTIPIYCTEKRYIRKDRSVIWGSLRVVVIQDTRGAPGYFFAQIQDITEYRTAAETLRKSEEKFRGMAERSSDLILIIDKGMSVTYASSSSRSILGYEPEELVGMTRSSAAATIFSPCLVEFNAPLQPAMRGTTIEKTGMQILKKNGETAWVELHAVPILHEGVFDGAQVTLRDITDKKKAEIALRESENTFNTIFRSSPVSLVLVSLNEGIFVDVNNVFLERTGFSREEILGKTTRELGLFTDPEEYELIASAVKNQERVKGREVKFRIKTGEILTCLYSSNIVFLKGKPHILSNVEDITPRRRAEEAVREREELFRSIVETSPNLIWEIDPAGKFRYMSPAGTSILGYTQEEILTMSIADLVPEDKREYARERLADIISLEGSLSPIEMPARHRDGHTIILEIRPARLNSSDRKLKGFRGVAIDITRRKNDEETLRLSRHQLAEAMDIAALANWEYDVATNLFTFDDRFYALYGTTAEREGGMQMSPAIYAREFIHPDDRHLLDQEIKSALATTDPGYTAQTEHRIIRRDGAIRHIVVRIGVNMNAGGRVIRTHGANQDITERKIAEEALRQANRQLSLLSGITRHDILNKITTIIGYLKIAEKRVDNSEMADFLYRIESATGAIRDQIEFTKVYQTLGTHEPQWIGLDRVLPRSQCPPSVTLTADVKDIYLYADPMLEKVFSNLLDNSIRHGERVTAIRVTSHPAGRDLVVVWEDDGVGIAAGEKELIFMRGFGKNTGLGMFLVREILSLTGISITETGELGKGARFEILVPAGSFRQ